ncbi:dienelactone hydrolase family protein [Phycicoccus sp. BSK3Z-2]|uniref:Dienelactone hydrolase family protein n=1 Tax=Phycicoccus avicenniae TaxID=2828860 RepID=A0A941D6D2_9MICO|nr:dienelactone hydrolase family protein [Phycicoccus avicenniae]MBR7742456.1 dienelactone hydrolase family protein [Phycicoccus avicenniae]
MSTVIEVATPDGPMPTHLWTPASGTGPGVLLLQEIFGVSPYVRRRAQDLADLGYAVLAPEIYWRIGVGEVADGPSMLDEGLAAAGRLDWDLAVADARTALDALAARDDVTGGVAVVGFCFGGGLGYAAVAERPADALVSFYGSALPDLVQAVPSVSTPSLHVFGEADSYIPMDVVARIRDSVTSGPAPADVVTYPGADHAFDNPDFVNHDPDASRDAWATATRWLGQRLPTG